MTTSRPTITPTEQVEAIRRVSALRTRPRIIDQFGGGHMDFSGLVALSEMKRERHECREGERDRYAYFKRRWGGRFHGSIIGRSMVAWQMHVCRLPVFETEIGENGRRETPRRFRRTRDALTIIRWFRSLHEGSRWILCEEYRDERSSGRAQRRRSEKSYHGRGLA